MSKYPNFNTPYEAGYDSEENGSSIGNCHFGFFSTPERTAEWERGRDAAKSAMKPERSVKKLDLLGKNKEGK